MPTFHYKARDSSGEAVTGTLSFESKDAIVRHLEEKGYLPISIEEEKGENAVLKPSSLGFGSGKIKEKDVNFFVRQLATLLRAGVPLKSSLETLQYQTQSVGLKKVIHGMLTDLDKGESLSAAFSHHPRVFSELYSAMVRAGEATGKLDEILARIAELGEYDLEIKTKLNTATFYPKLIVGIMMVAFLFITTFVLPRFTRVFDQVGVELIASTKFLLWLNHFLRHYWFLAIFLAGGTLFGIRTFLRSPLGRNFWDGFKLKIPVFGPLFHQFAISRFSRMFSVTTQSGVPILEGLEIVSRSVGNMVVSKAVLDVRESVRAGQGIARPMHQNRLFPPIVVRMVAIGEETGKLDELLLRVSEYYDFEVDNAIKKLTVLIEPVLLVVLGGMVLFLILSIFVPLLNYYTKLAHGA